MAEPLDEIVQNHLLPHEPRIPGVVAVYEWLETLLKSEDDEATGVINVLLRDLGAHVLIPFLHAAGRRRNRDPDEDQNAHDLLVAEAMLTELAVALGHFSHMIPPETTDLLARVCNALRDVRLHKVQPALFDVPPGPPVEEELVWTIAPAKKVQAILAAALELLILGGWRLRDASRLLDDLIRRNDQPPNGGPS
jgi:hypothetical protein